MRYVIVLFLAVFFFISMIFFVQNTELYNTTIQLKLNVLGTNYQSKPQPIYLLILGAFVLGVIVTTLYFFLEKIRLSSKVREQRALISRHEQELTSLRNMPIESTSYPSPSSDSEDGSDQNG